MTETLTAMPSVLRAGDTLVYRRSLSDYPASGGWTLKATLAGASAITVTAVADGDTHVVTFTAVETGALTAGLYQFLERVEKGAEKYTVADGEASVLPNVATAAAGALADVDEALLADIEAELRRRAGEGAVDAYTIANRSVQRMSMKDLYDLRSKLKAKLSVRKMGGDWFQKSVRVTFTGTENEQ